MKENLIVLFGGVSVEHDISIISGLQAINNIDKNFVGTAAPAVKVKSLAVSGK